MKKKPLISVVVPVYNSEKYLRDCLNSICNQSYKNLEVILVNDGSTDNSYEICKSYSKKDSRIKVLSQNNSGQHKARCAGIEIAEGDYISFIDSDDYIAFNMYEMLLFKIECCDFISSGINRFNENGLVTYTYKDVLEVGIYKSEPQLNYFFNNLLLYDWQNASIFTGSLLGVGNSMACKLFKTKIVKGIYKKINRNIVLGEDLLFVLLYILNSKSFVITHDAYYYARDHELSVTHKIFPHYLKDKDELYYAIHDVIKGHPYEKVLSAQFNKRFIRELRCELSQKLEYNYEHYFPMIYLVPSIKKICNKKIVLFGAGKVGKSYYEQIVTEDIGTIVLWIDNDINSNVNTFFPVSNIESILDVDFDVVLIAIANKVIADEIRKQLSGYNIDDNKIFWQKPLSIA